MLYNIEKYFTIISIFLISVFWLAILLKFDYIFSISLSLVITFYYNLLFNS